MEELPVVTFLGPREPEVEVEVVVGEVVDESVETQTATLKLSGEFLSRGGPRETLRRKVEANADELADVVVAGALGEGKVNQAKLALDAIHRADPVIRGSASVRYPRTPQEVNALSMSELIAFAEEVGLDIPKGLRA